MMLTLHIDDEIVATLIANGMRVELGYAIPAFQRRLTDCLRHGVDYPLTNTLAKFNFTPGQDKGQEILTKIAGLLAEVHPGMTPKWTKIPSPTFRETDLVYHNPDSAPGRFSIADTRRIGDALQDGLITVSFKILPKQHAGDTARGRLERLRLYEQTREAASINIGYLVGRGETSEDKKFAGEVVAEFLKEMTKPTEDEALVRLYSAAVELGKVSDKFQLFSERQEMSAEAPAKVDAELVAHYRTITAQLQAAGRIVSIKSIVKGHYDSISSRHVSVFAYDRGKYFNCYFPREMKAEFQKTVAAFGELVKITGRFSPGHRSHRIDPVQKVEFLGPVDDSYEDVPPPPEDMDEA